MFNRIRCPFSLMLFVVKVTIIGFVFMLNSNKDSVPLPLMKIISKHVFPDINTLELWNFGYPVFFLIYRSSVIVGVCYLDVHVGV